MSSHQNGAVRRAIDPGGSPPGAGGPRPIPELLAYAEIAPVPSLDHRPGDAGGLPAGDRPTAEGPVTDEDRTRYGVLLDRAAERGLLAPYDYEVRLRELAEAITFDEMRLIVTELPVFTAPLPTTGSKRSRRPGSQAGPTDRPTLAGTGRRRTGTWVVLAVLVLVLVVSTVFLSIYVEHLARAHHSGLRAPGAPGLSALRL